MKKIVIEPCASGEELLMDLTCDCGFTSFTDEESGLNYRYLSIKVPTSGTGEKITKIKCDRCGQRYEIKRKMGRIVLEKITT